MKNKRIVLYSLIIILAGVIYFAVQVQQKNGAHRANFSGEWKSKESISMGVNIVCAVDKSDRMMSKNNEDSSAGRSSSHRNTKPVSWRSAGYKPGETGVRR